MTAPGLAYLRAKPSNLGITFETLGRETLDFFRKVCQPRVKGFCALDTCSIERRRKHALVVFRDRFNLEVLRRNLLTQAIYGVVELSRGGAIISVSGVGCCCCFFSAG